MFASINRGNSTTLVRTPNRTVVLRVALRVAALLADRPAGRCCGVQRRVELGHELING